MNVCLIGAFLLLLEIMDPRVLIPLTLVRVVVYLVDIVRSKCPDHVVLLNETHPRHLLREPLTDYHRARTRVPLGKNVLDPGPVQRLDQSRIVNTPMVGGLHHRYTRRAA